MSPTSIVIDDAARRDQAKERLYFVLQVAGWGLFAFMQLMYMQIYGDAEYKQNQLKALASVVELLALGILVTHYARTWIERHGWKQMGWRQLIPRMIFMAGLQSAVWDIVSFGYEQVVLHEPWDSKYRMSAVIFASWLNGALIFFGWLGLYFFYHLYDRFNRAQIERLQLMTSVKDAELRALKSQVNPHFIFNSLNSMRALIEEDPARARQSVTQLANLLRYALQSAHRETVPFEQELDIVNDYLALEQVRHEERLRLRLDVSPDTLCLPVPPMLLQTLVENAVKYGISTRPEGGEITIVARRENGFLRLQVTNPGDLMTAGADKPISTGLGLKNAAERLKLIFGENASLQLRRASPMQVMAEATIPLSQPS